MKKFVVGALCACMVSSLLTGCGSGASTGSVDNSSSGGLLQQLLQIQTK